MTRVRLTYPIVLELDGGVVLTITANGPVHTIRAKYSADEHPGEVRVFVDENMDINFYMKPISSEV